MEPLIKEREHQLLLNAINDHAIFMIDTRGHIISWNEGAKRLKGYEDHEVMGKHFRFLFLPEDQDDRPEQKIREALETGKSEEEWWRLKKDGSKFWAHVILRPVYDENKVHIGFAKITRDKTEHKRIDELNTFLMNEVSGYAIFQLDRQGRIAKWSKAAESILGFTEKEVIGKSMTLFHAYNNNNETNLDIERQLEDGADKFESEGWNIKKDGSHFWASYMVSQLHNRNGFVVMMRDLTEKRAFDQTMKTNTALVASNKELERFAFVVTHDLKEPIRKITTYCHMLQVENQRQEHFVTRILNACTRVNNLIDDILKFSTLTGTQNFVNHDLNLLLQNVLDSLSETIGARQAVIEAEPLPTCLVIPSQIEQLFQNLISNAMKFCNPDRNPHIIIRCAIMPKERLPETALSGMLPADHYLKLEFQDNGIGFEQEHADNIFELFQRLHDRSQFEGTGVGLSICKKVVENHGGAITAHSKEGEGALFTMILPCHQPQ